MQQMGVEGRELRVKLAIPEDMRLHYANHLHVNHDETGFFITFGQLSPPPVLHPEEYDQMEEVPSYAVCRLAVPAAVLPGIIETLQRNLQRWQAAYAAETPEEERE